jgi:nucleoside phosphorylase
MIEGFAKRLVSRHKPLLTVFLLVAVWLLYSHFPEPTKQHPEGKGPARSLVYVFAASKREGGPVDKLIAGPEATHSGTTEKSGRIGTNLVRLFVTGMGPQQASSSVATALSASSQSGLPVTNRTPDAIVVVGFCGGLSPSLQESDIVAYSGCQSTVERQEIQQCSTELTKKLVGLLSSRGIRSHVVSGITSSRIATSKADKLCLGKSRAQAVDMESYEIISAANRIAVPVVVLRVVSDSLDREMPDFNEGLNADGKVDGWRMAKVLLGSPIMTVRLFSASRQAMRKLSDALEVILPADCYAAERRSQSVTS